LTATDDPDFLPGGAKYFDLPGLIALCAPGEIWLRDMAGGSKEADAQPAEGSEIVSAAYKAAGAANQIVWYEGPADKTETAALEWLLQK
jgi:hypothetical protein